MTRRPPTRRPTRRGPALVALAVAISLLNLDACTDGDPGPLDVPPDPGASLDTTAGPTARRSTRRNDFGATRAAEVGPLSTTPLGPPPLEDRGMPLLRPPVERIVPAPRRHRPEGAAQRDATSSKMLRYHGGVIQKAPRIYLVYWGPNWFSGGDPDGVANRLNLFLKGIGGSTYAEGLKEYEGAGTTFTNPRGQYRGWRHDKLAIPTHPTRAQVEAAVRRAAAYFNDFSYNALYVIATPWGVTDQRLNDHDWCAWHNWIPAGSRWVTFAVIPYMPYLDALGRGCGGGTVNGSTGKLDGVTILAAHEYTETVNDPSFEAWYDVDGDEIADKCSWINLRNTTLTNGYSFPVQPMWSNRLRQEQGNGCGYQ
jgi:hypothetical protein